jgi:hypothetical protein
VERSPSSFAERRALLLAQIEHERMLVSNRFDEIERLATNSDRAIATARGLLTNPFVLGGVATVALASGPRRLLRLLARAAKLAAIVVPLWRHLRS